MDFLGQLGCSVLQFLTRLGQASLFLLQALMTPPRLRSFRLLLKQFYVVGVLSLPIIVMASFFVGMVLGLQGYTVLVKFGAESALGQLIALSLVRELGPVLGGLLFAGRACSALTAEIALLKTTEQLDSLRLLGVDPIHRVIAPRLWAGFFCLPLLVIIFNAVSIYGGYWVSVHWLGIDSGSFWASMQHSVDFREDIVNGIIKSIVFAIAVTWIAVYQGYVAVPTSEGIGYATTRTVVYASVMILALDF
ncbi:MAG TPA: lipid asymmetry maintenance ABC transporter permease subunit MlaE, partial [Gammaproteobacteria bacterium]|nr:lipid asymmetry maintenance ABC transporter permease subunit MlaE [Gammaproteobacteria bacterium]